MLLDTLVGTGKAGRAEDGTPATSAPINGPYGLALDAAGNLYVAEASNHLVRKVDAETGVITTVAGER